MTSRFYVTVKPLCFAVRILLDVAGLRGGIEMQHLLVGLSALIVFDQNHEKFATFILQ